MGLIKFQCISVLITFLYLILYGNIFQASARTIDPTLPFAVVHGKFAVSEYNKKHRTSFVFRSVVEGNFELVKGVGHIHLIIKVTSKGVEHKYDVLVNHYQNKPKQLEKFALLQ
ncbi:hypothetical protein ABFS82_01G077000 [Erythranthe guttata]